MSFRYTASQLLHIKPSPSNIWVLQGLLRSNRKRPSLLCGLPGSGKSTLAQQLALSVASGRPFLGRDTQLGHVIYWKNEDSEQDIADDLRKAGLNEQHDLTFIVPAPGDNQFKDLGEALKERPDTKLVIVETLADFLSVDDINNNDDCRIGLQRFANEIMQPYSNCAYLMLHQFNKSDSESRLSVTRIQGGTALAAFSDARIYLEQRSNEDPRRVIHATARKGEGIDPTFLEFDPDTLTSSLGQTVIAEKGQAKQLQKTQAVQELDSKIGIYLASHPGTAKWDVVNEVGGNAQKVGKHIDDMIDAGLIVAQKGGEKGNALVLYPMGTELPNGNIVPLEVAA